MRNMLSVGEWGCSEQRSITDRMAFTEPADAPVASRKSERVALARNHSSR